MFETAGTLKESKHRLAQSKGISGICRIAVSATNDIFDDAPDTVKLFVKLQFPSFRVVCVAS